MPVELVSRFPVADDELNALHARAFGGEIRTTPWQHRGFGRRLVEAAAP